MKTENRILIIPDFMIVLRAIRKLKKSSITDLHHETEVTYCHLHAMVKELKQQGYIYIEKEGVKNAIFLSSKGDEVVLTINKLLKQMGINNNTINEFRRKSKIRKKEETQDGRED